MKTAWAAAPPMNRKEKWVIAHRGAHSKEDVDGWREFGNARENTLAPFKLAALLGADMLAAEWVEGIITNHIVAP